jgi:RNA-directed DNA polymerase
VGLKRWFGRWWKTDWKRWTRGDPNRSSDEPPPWRYPDPFTGKPVQPVNDADPALLQAGGLPVLGTLADLARATGLPWQKVLWLAAPSTRYVGGPPHYYFFTLPKSHGGQRLILAPKPTLKTVQRWILDRILVHVPLPDPVHGFRTGRSTRTNAEPHCGKEVVIRFDLKDFFHTVTYRRIRGLFRSLGYSTEVSVLLGLLTTFRPDAYPYEYMRHVPHLIWLRSMSAEQRTYRGYPTTPPFLPQGAPTSPALANLVARGLDHRLAGLARRFEATYTRYADDLTFSGDRVLRRDIARFVPLVNRIARDEGFFVATRKQRIRRKGSRQSVTGVVVNQHPNLPRDIYRHLRVLVHKAATLGPNRVYLDRKGPQGPQRLRAYLEGWIAYLSHLNPTRGAELRARLDAVVWPTPGSRR